MKLKLYALFCLTLFTTSALAHAGHDHDHNEDSMDVEDVTEADFDFDSTESKSDVEPKSSVVKPDFKVKSSHFFVVLSLASSLFPLFFFFHLLIS